jgi:hypothetical protein
MRTVRIALLAALAALSTAPAGAQPPGVPCPTPPQFEQEPNDTPATATVLTGFEGNLVSRSPGSISPAGDVDFFRIQVAPGARLSVLLDTGVLAQLPGGNTRDSVVQVLAPDGVTVLEVDDDDGTGQGAVVSGEESSIVGLAASGTLFIRVAAKNPAQVLSPYVLWVNASTNTSVNEIEPNDTQGQAMFADSGPILGSLASSTDVDWYLRGLLGGGPHMIFVDGDPERDGTTTDVRIDFAPGSISPPAVNSSLGPGQPPPGSEALFMGSFSFSAQFFRISGPAAGTYSVLVTFIGSDACNVPVELTSFEVR